MNDEQRQELIRRLRQGEELSPEWARILFPPEKREYELVYHGKEREEDIIGDTLAVPLQKVRTFGKNGDDWHNMLVFGDNLQVMKSLLALKRTGKLCNGDGTPGVRLVYIDPPFATKQDFAGNRDQKAYQDKITGAAFVEFLRKRLVLIRELLADDGSVVVHLDARKGHYIKLILDEVFSEHNFRNEMIVKRRITKNLQQQFSAIQSLPVAHDCLYWYSKSSSTRFTAISVTTEGKEEGYWHHFWSGADRPTMRYRLLKVKPETGQWKWRKAKALAAVSNYKDYLKQADERSLAQYWADTGRKLKFIRLSGKGKVENWYPPSTERIGDTLWLDIHAYPNVKSYPTEKDEELLKRVIELGTGDDEDLVLDAFAGSGTTCAVAEKLGRRWIGIDCGKLSIYTMQKRLLNLNADIGNKGARLSPRPFGLYNAGLYDFSKLKELPWDAWRFFALQLFQCRDEPHKVGGIHLDGYLKGSSVLVFNHQKQPGVRIDEATIQSMHEALGSKVGSRMFIVAPALVFDFQQDYLILDGVRFYALRIPYSIIHELHQREFAALKQPADELAVNDTVDAVGFDFVRRPELDYEAGPAKRKGEAVSEGVIKIRTFKSEAVVREPMRKKGNRETLSMVMLDYDFNRETDVFEFDAIVYAEDIEKADWEVRFPVEAIGDQVMAVFVDIYGNEAREVIPGSRFGAIKGKPPAKPPKNKRRT
jgi:site-specific DNA-methyltransferase (adenine-specific)/adenine-specific DNA-methyltransferase